VAVSRKFCCTVIRVLNDDSLLDQLVVTVFGSSGKIPMFHLAVILGFTRLT